LALPGLLPARKPVVKKQRPKSCQQCQER